MIITEEPKTMDTAEDTAQPADNAQDAGTGSNGKQTEGSAVTDNPFVDLIRKVSLASVGAVVLAQEEVEEFINRLVQKGEIAERDGRKLIKDIVSKRKKQTRKTVDSAVDEVDSTIGHVLHSINIPTKRDVSNLASKIEAIGEQLDKLTKKRR